MADLARRLLYERLLQGLQVLWGTTQFDTTKGEGNDG
jgi:hypothetical protein